MIGIQSKENDRVGPALANPIETLIQLQPLRKRNAFRFQQRTLPVQQIDDHFFVGFGLDAVEEAARVQYFGQEGDVCIAKGAFDVIENGAGQLPGIEPYASLQPFSVLRKKGFFQSSVFIENGDDPVFLDFPVYIWLRDFGVHLLECGFYAFRDLFICPSEGTHQGEGNHYYSFHIG